MRGMQPAAGSLLIASATLLDPNFARCVLLILNSDSDGTLGEVQDPRAAVDDDETL